MMGAYAVGGRAGERIANPHGWFEKTTDAIGVSGNIRERLWVRRMGAGDWHAWAGRSDIYHFTSSDGVSWSKDTNNPVYADASRQLQDVCCFRDPWSDREVIIAEDEDNLTTILLSASSVNADSWTFEDEFTTKFGSSEMAGIPNPTPWYASGEDRLYAYLEEFQSSGADYVRTVSTTSDPTVASNWVDEGRAIPLANYSPKCVWTENGSPRLGVIRRTGIIQRWQALRPVNGDLTTWEQAGLMFVGGSGKGEDGYGELTPPHEANGWEEYFPEGESKPWGYAWNNIGPDADNNYDLLKGQ